MNRKSLLPIMLCVFAVPELSAQTPPSQKPEVEVPHAQAACDCHDLEALNARVSRDENTLKDWPELARYQEANSKVVAPAKNERRVV
ncbi:MAG TPA: hypothetical protein VFP96_10590, partial [Candidatus Acidoferrum sp.]|nr:hypothetical protein [Candidatus Acidoferrum sp.]